MANGDNPLINPAAVYGYNPWQTPPSAGVPTNQGFTAFAGEPQQPYYNPFNPELGHGGEGALLTTSPISEVNCPEGYVKDLETNTCVPIEEAMAAVERGDRDKNRSFGPVANTGGDGTFFGYTSFADFFDGGGPGRSGPTFQGSLAGTVANAFGIKPYGYEKRYGVGGTHDYGGGSTAANVMSETNRLAYDDALKAAEQALASGKSSDRDDDDRQSAHDRRHAANVAKRKAYSEKHKDAGTTTSRDLGQDVKDRLEKYGRSDDRLKSNKSLIATTDDGIDIYSYRKDGEWQAGPIAQEVRETHPELVREDSDGYLNVNYQGLNRGGQVTNGLIAYRQEGGPVPLPGAIPPNPEQPAGPPMDPGMAPPAGPVGPAGPPMAPPVPPAPVKKSFAEKVAEAKAAIQGGGASVPVMPELAAPEPMGMDGQMDGPVMIHPEAGMTSPGMVGPDMGPDTVDAELEEGAMVMNPEASEMFADELQGLFNGGRVYG